jgi:hypothetical protein
MSENTNKILLVLLTVIIPLALLLVNALLGVSQILTVIIIICWIGFCIIVLPGFLELSD